MTEGVIKGIEYCIEALDEAALAAAPTPPACRYCAGDGVGGGAANIYGKYEIIPCPECGGDGAVDSGGTLPWGEPAKMQCKCAPTPPAQDDEPVYQRRIMNHDDAAWFDVTREEFMAERVIEKRILYTRPDTSELRKAAEEFYEWAETVMPNTVKIDEEGKAANLRAALERK